MDCVLLFLCVIWIIMSYYTKHVYKAKCVSHSNSFGFALGSVFGSLTDGIAWYWLFKLIKLWSI